jgi:hypothetical protein
MALEPTHTEDEVPSLIQVDNIKRLNGVKTIKSYRKVNQDLWRDDDKSVCHSNANSGVYVPFIRLVGRIVDCGTPGEIFSDAPQ